MQTSPIGIFDSGIGGLTVLKALLKKLPQENFVYFADTINLPYGNKSKEQILQYTHSILSWMQDTVGAKIVVAACHTSSALALGEISADFSVPVVGTITPLLNTIYKNEALRIGLIATPATATSRAHENIFRQHGFNGEIVTIACPDFVPLIEAGIEKGQLDIDLLKTRATEYLMPFQERKLNTLIYGCTHYPLIKHVFEELLPKTTLFIDPAEAVVAQVTQYLTTHNLYNNSGGHSPIQFHSSDNHIDFQSRVIAVLS